MQAYENLRHLQKVARGYRLHVTDSTFRGQPSLPDLLLYRFLQRKHSSVIRLCLVISPLTETCKACRFLRESALLVLHIAPPVSSDARTSEKHSRYFANFKRTGMHSTQRAQTRLPRRLLYPSQRNQRFLPLTLFLSFHVIPNELQKNIHDR